MLLKFYFIACLAILSVYAQGDIDPTFCNFVPVTPSVDFPTIDDKARYSVEIERNSGDKKFTQEIREYYDGGNDIGVSITTFTGQTVKTISNYKSDEILFIDGYGCLVRKLSESWSATPFFVTTDANGTEHIATALTLLTKVLGVNVVYQGEAVSRGVPSRQWGACIYDKNSNSTVRMLFEYSNPDKWTPANPDGLKSVPLQITLDSKNKYTQTVTSSVDFITRFRLNNQIDEEKYFSNPGVYCAGRVNTKPFPKVPDVFTTWIQYSMPSNYSSYIEGAMRTYRVEHDFPRKLYRLDYYDTNDRYTEVHDYSTGLVYKMNRYKQTCEIKTIEDINSDTEPQSSALLFETTQTPEYQNTGSRRVRGINTDVWIAPRKYQGSDTIWEWDFMTDQWVSQETNAVKTNEPVLLSIYVPVDTNNKLRLQFHFTQFDQSRIDLYDYDISTCQQNIANKHITFSFNSESYETFKANQGAFKQALMGAVQQFGEIGLLRIGKLQTIFEKKTIHAVMTLFDRPDKYGPVPEPPRENNLAGAYETLKKAITSGSFTFTVPIATMELSIKADSDSFQDLDENNGRYFYVNVDTDQTLGYTSGAVVGFVIGFLVVGLLCGFVGGYFLIIKRGIPLELPGILNPNFKASA